MLVTWRIVVRSAARLELELAAAHRAGWLVARGAALDGGQVVLLLRDGWLRPGWAGWC